MKPITVISFGTSHLKDFDVPTGIQVIVTTTQHESKARQLMLNTPGIGNKFSTTYSYEDYLHRFHEIDTFELTYQELMLRRKL